MNKFICLASLLFGLIYQTSAQQTFVHLDHDQLYFHALDLIAQEQYGAARKTFENYLQENADPLKRINAEYYIAYAAVRLYHADGEKLLNEFVASHANHPKAISAYYELGTFYFKDKKYRKAIEYFEKLNFEKLSENQATEARFKLAYAYFGFKEFDKAKEHFDLLKLQNNQYSHASSYYAGYIAYKQGEFYEALVDFERAEENESYASVIPYLKSNIYYRQGRYPELVEYGLQVIERDDIRDREGIQLLIGDAYYQQQNYDAAAQYLSEYASDKSFQSDPKIFYKVAYAQYQTGKTDQAIESFKKVALLPDSLGQYASYYLGILYLQNDQKQFAFNALERAKNENFAPQIKEEAIFQYAKVSYDLQQYAEAIAAFKEYVGQYPNGTHFNEANDLLGEAYLNTTNYDLAIEHIESLKLKSESIKQTYQKVTYYKGTELFNLGEYREAVTLFQKSLTYPKDREILVQAYYWMGEAYSIGNKYEEAINAYASVFRSVSDNNLYHLKSRYGIAYAYYNNKQYDRALVHFKEYVDKLRNSSNKYFYDDALLRLADCYYVSKAYSEALDIYNRALRSDHPDKDYAYYQIGVVNNLAGNTSLAQTNLNTVISSYPRSRYHDDAMFELAQINFEQGNYEVSINGFSSLINRHPQSPFVPYALQNRAIANFNLQNYEKTATDYKRILDEYINHELANSALLGLQEVLTIQGDSESLSPYLARYKRANPENDKLKNIEFESAKSLYYNQKYDKAIAAFQEYIQTYPDVAQAFEAKYFLGECYYRSNQPRKALETYYAVVEENKTSYVNRAIRRIAELEQQDGDLSQSIVYYKRLAKLAQNKKEQYNAWSGLMEIYFELQNFDSVSYFANLIIEKGAVSVNAENKAYLFLGKSAFEQNQYDQAIDYFLRTLNTAKDENGAEAQYLMAKIQYEQENYRQSIETLYNLNQNFNLYEDWIGRSFLLIAENYYKLDEIYQAKATLQSVIDKSPNQQIIEQAQNRLKEIEKEEQDAVPQDTFLVEPTNEAAN